MSSNVYYTEGEETGRTTSCYTFGTGGTTQLNAFGSQDANFLNGDEINFFNKKNVQHTYFNLIYNSYPLYPHGNVTWPFEQQNVVFTLNPKVSGDLLANAYLKLTMPALPVGKDAGVPDPANPGNYLVQPHDYCYTDRLGYALIDKITMSVNGEAIDTVYGDWLLLQNEIFADDSIRRATDSIINAGQIQGDGVLSESPTTCQTPIPLYIPLSFFFSRNHYHTTSKVNRFKPFFYTCASYEQIISFSVVFTKQAFFTNYTASPLQLDAIYLVTEEIVLTPAERNYYRQNPITSVVDAIEIQPKLDIDEQPGNEAGDTGPYPNKFKDFLSCNRPVKSIHFFARRYHYETDMNLPFWRYRFDFSSQAESPNPASSVPADVPYDPYKEDANQVVERSELFIKNESRYSDNSPNYLKNIITIIHELNPPIRNIYNYCFALRPKDPVPNGSVNFSQLQPRDTLVPGSIYYDKAQKHNYIINLFYVAIKIIEYQNGSVRTRFI